MRLRKSKYVNVRKRTYACLQVKELQAALSEQANAGGIPLPIPTLSSSLGALDLGAGLERLMTLGTPGEQQLHQARNKLPETEEKAGGGEGGTEEPPLLGNLGGDFEMGQGVIGEAKDMTHTMSFGTPGEEQSHEAWHEQPAIEEQAVSHSAASAGAGANGGGGQGRNGKREGRSEKQEVNGGERGADEQPLFGNLGGNLKVSQRVMSLATDMKNTTIGCQHPHCRASCTRADALAYARTHTQVFETLSSSLAQTQALSATWTQEDEEKRRLRAEVGPRRRSWRGI